MSRLLEVAELQHTAELVAREAQALLVHATAEHAKLEEAIASGDPAAVHIVTNRLARIARQLTRAQAQLVHPSDRRYGAAQAVIGYCDEADQKGPWEPAAPPLRIGVAS